jgi:Fic family protein
MIMSKSQKFKLYDHPSQMEPLLPGEHRMGPVLEQAHDLIRKADRLSGWCPSGALPGLRQMLRAMNSYYSHRIEGQHTLPLEIEQALRNDYAQDSDKARRQRLALAHMATEAQLEQRMPAWTNQQVWSAQTVQDIHQDLFARLPEPDLLVPSTPGMDAPSHTLTPGAWRTREVSVGRHAAPSATELPAFMSRWAEAYGQARRGEMQVVAMAAAHQRLAWIHPFLDGNGRVARLHSHLVLGHMGLTNGLWSPLRGFARTQADYYAHLAAADEPRAGDLDGRGNLSEAALLLWIKYMLNTCLDQVSFMSQILSLQDMKSRMAACLAFEEQVVRQGVRSESLRALHYLFAAKAELDRADFKAMLGLGDRLATAQVSALLKRGLLESDSPHGKLRLGVPQHALRFYFPGLWPEAQG